MNGPSAIVGWIAVIFAGLFMAITSCTQDPAQTTAYVSPVEQNYIILQQEHAIRRMAPKEGVSGQIEGTFFIGLGSVNGKMDSTSSIQFDWAPSENNRITSKVPLDKLIVEVDNSKTSPSIVFNLINPGRLTLTQRDSLTGDTHLNTYLSLLLNSATVKISEKDLKDNPCLPQ